MQYTQNEKVDLLLIYGECQKNAHAAARLYYERYPDRRQPYRQYFKILEESFRNAENIEVAEDRFIVSEEIETNVLAYTHVYPNVSTRELAKEIDIGRETVRRILKKHGFKCYKYQLHQELYENDGNRRLIFCNWFTQHVYLNNRILFSDESRFTNNGMYNRHNLHYWSKENLHEMFEGNHQDRFGVNVWAGIFGTKIIGPILFQGPLTGARYLSFLQNEIENELDELSLEDFRNMYFQQDGAPPHNAGFVENYLNAKFDNRVISTNGTIRWPARSPDLTPLDFFLWGYLKDKVYSTPSATLEELQNKILNAFESITPVMLQSVMRETIRRVNKCSEMGGRHFEHLL